jgi:hypothetical protein
VDALEAICVTQGAEWTPEALRTVLAAHPDWAWVTNTRRLAGLLNPLGFVRERVREGTQLRWMYRLNPAALVDLRARYSGSPDPQ